MPLDPGSSSQQPAEACSSPPPAKHASSSWPAAVASLLFTYFAVRAFLAYSFVHWQVLAFDRFHLNRDAEKAFWQVLGDFDSLRLSGVAAVAFALWSFRGRPRWVAIIAAVVSLIGFSAAFMVM